MHITNCGITGRRLTLPVPLGVTLKGFFCPVTQFTKDNRTYGNEIKKAEIAVRKI